MFRQLRMLFYRHHLKQQLNQHQTTHQVVGLSTANTIGILFDGTNENSLASIKEYARKLEQKNKKITLLGYIDSNRASQNPSFPSFSRKDVNWYFQPVHNLAKTFADKHFDILINVFLSESATLEYISTFSKAKFRVGPYASDKTYCYDLMINVDKTNSHPSTSLENYIEKVDHYLNNIQSVSKA